MIRAIAELFGLARGASPKKSEMDDFTRSPGKSGRDTICNIRLRNAQT